MQTFFVAHSQELEKKLLQEKVMANGLLFQENINKALVEMEVLLKEAVQIKDSLSELKLLERKCLYYYNREDVDGLIVACKAFERKANEYGNPQFLAMVHVYLAETFSMNGLHERGLAELDKALKTLENVKDKNLKYVYTKANVLISQGNIYNDRNEPKKAAEKILKAIKSYDALDDPNEIQKLQHLNYANLASTYASFNLDSAAYYVEKSIRLKPKNTSGDDWMMGLNYMVLGKVHQKKGENETALSYFLKAEAISEKRGEFLNRSELYNCILSVYTLLGKPDLVNQYKEKLKENELITLQSKYNSLHKVLDGSETKTTFLENNLIWILLLISFVALIVSLILFRNYKKTIKKESLPKEIKYDSLINMIKNDDPAFVFHFEELYPDFKSKILSIEPNLSQSDMEFCILLKLNLGTKKIAQLKFLEVRTVQNKKYRIRKKLNIPQEANLYNWFSEV